MNIYYISHCNKKPLLQGTSRASHNPKLKGEEMSSILVCGRAHHVESSASNFALIFFYKVEYSKNCG